MMFCAKRRHRRTAEKVVEEAHIEAPAPEEATTQYRDFREAHKASTPKQSCPLTCTYAGPPPAPQWPRKDSVETRSPRRPSCKTSNLDINAQWPSAAVQSDKGVLDTTW